MFMNKMSKSAKPKIQLKKLKELDNRLWHPDSTLVFNEDKKVIGRYENEELVSLDETSIELCVKWGFKYDESLLEDGTEEEEEAEGLEEQEADGDAEEGEEGEEGEEEAEDQEDTAEDEEAEEQEDEKRELIKKIEKAKKQMKEDDKAKKIEKESEDTNSISDLTKDYTNKIHIFFNELKLETNTKITNLQNELSQSEKDLREMTDKYELEHKNHNNLKNKFNAVKSLFSV